MRKDDYTYDDYLAELSKLPEKDDDDTDKNERA